MHPRTAAMMLSRGEPATVLERTDQPRSAAGSGSRVSRKPRRFGGSAAQVVIYRLLLSVPLFFVVTVLSFVLVSVAPGDPAAEILGINASPEAYTQLRDKLGLNFPLYEQYGHWLSHAISGDFGTSVYSGESVTSALQARFPVTLWLMIGAMVTSLVVGVAAGMFSAIRGGIAGRFVDALTLVAFSLPSFWIGAVLISLFAVRVGWFPATGYVAIGDSPSLWARSLVLPVAALSLHPMAAIARQTREAMLDVLGSEFVRVARANGVSKISIIFRHALKNAGIRVVTILGLQAIGLLGGTVIVESVFAMPGLGSLAVEAALRKDLPVIQGVVALFTIIVIVVNLAVDLTYSLLNPRVKMR